MDQINASRVEKLFRLGGVRRAAKGFMSLIFAMSINLWADPADVFSNDFSGCSLPYMLIEAESRHRQALEELAAAVGEGRRIGTARQVLSGQISRPQRISEVQWIENARAVLNGRVPRGPGSEIYKTVDTATRAKLEQKVQQAADHLSALRSRAQATSTAQRAPSSSDFQDFLEVKFVEGQGAELLPGSKSNVGQEAVVTIIRRENGQRQRVRGTIVGESASGLDIRDKWGQVFPLDHRAMQFEQVLIKPRP